jgi:hypothetical protein
MKAAILNIHIGWLTLMGGTKLFMCNMKQIISVACGIEVHHLSVKPGSTIVQKLNRETKKEQ